MNIYEADLENLFAELMAFGTARRRTEEIMRWVTSDRQVPSFWQKLRDKFIQHLSEEERKEGWRFYATQNEEQMTLLCFDPVQVKNEDPWWSDVGKMASAPSPGPKKRVIRRI